MPYFLSQLSPFDTYLTIKHIIDTVPINDAKSMLKNFISQAQTQFKQQQKYNYIIVLYNRESLQFNLSEPSVIDNLIGPGDPETVKNELFEINLAVYFLVKKLDQNSLPDIFLHTTIPETLDKKSLGEELGWLYRSYTTPKEIADLASSIERNFAKNNLLLDQKTSYTEMSETINATSSSNKTLKQTTIEETQL